MKKIAIIKLGAKGDVIRTLSILPAIKEKFPESEVTWITKSNISDLITNQMIDRILEIPCTPEENFDALYNFDIESSATDLAESINATEKFGFYSDSGFPAAFNPGAEYYLNTIFDDTLKKENKKTYQEMMFDAADLPYKKQNFPLVDKVDKTYSYNFLNSNNLLGKKLLGIHMGASPRWPSKAWHKDKVKELIQKVRNLGYEVILFGGPDEVNEHAKFASELAQSGIKVHQNNPNNSDREFTSLVNLCDKMICSDSFALHVALALNKQTIALFFCTTPHEVEGHGLLNKIVSPLLYDFFPEKQDKYSEELVNSISVDAVLKSIED